MFSPIFEIISFDSYRLVTCDIMPLRSFTPGMRHLPDTILTTTVLKIIVAKPSTFNEPILVFCCTCFFCDMPFLLLYVRFIFTILIMKCNSAYNPNMLANK